MQFALTLLALGASVVVAQDAGAAPPGGCQPSFSGTFSFQTTNITSGSRMMARELDDVLGRPVRRQAASCGSSVTLTLNNGVLLDAKGRTGYIAANRQFQFDGPPQAGHQITSGFSVCGNGSLALGASTVFYNCLSGTFDNIYDQSQGAQCFQVNIDTFPCAATGSVVTVPTSLISAPGEETNSQVATSSVSQSLMVMTAQTSAAPSSVSAKASVASSSVASVVSTPVAASSVATPYPKPGNSTAPAPSGSAPVITTPAVSSPAGSSPAGSSSPAVTSFKGAASVLAVGQGFVALIAAAGAFFML